MREWRVEYEYVDEHGVSTKGGRTTTQETAIAALLLVLVELPSSIDISNFVVRVTRA